MRPTLEQLRARRDALVRQESTQPEQWWWLSFSDKKFLGGVAVFARGFVSAVELTRVLRINPGGEVKGVALPKAPPPEFANRLLSREEIEQHLGGAVKWER